MPTRPKVRRATPKRRTVAVAARSPTRAARLSRPGSKRDAKPVKRGHATAHRGTGATKHATLTEVKPPSVHGPGHGFTKAMRYLDTLTDFERLRIVRYNSQNFDLERMRTLLKKMGNPHEQFKSVHVAGTKGKGSTCAMLASMLQACGYKVGLYTSPHLNDIRERIVVNGQMISHADFGRLIRNIEPIASRMRPTPTYFDVLTAAAFKYFAEQKIDIAVVETGLGGRLDSTNVISPEVTAITSLSKDHMAQLGYTLEKIAEEKAGIFKAGVPAVTVMQDPDAEAVIKRIAEKVGAPLDIAGKSIEFSYRFESSRLLGPH